MAWKQGLGSTYQAYSSKLTDIAALAVTDSNFIVGNGTTWVAESGATVRASLGLIIGTDVQAYDAQLADIAAVTPSANQFLGGDGSNLVMRTAAQVKTSLGYYTSGDSPTFATATLTAGTIATTPTSGTDIANKSYVDSIAAGLRDFKDSVRVATNAALPAYSRTGNVITASANGALTAVDGITLVAADRLLLKNGASGVDNGIYAVTTVGDVSNPYVLTRTTDADTSAEVTSGMYCWVSEGTVNGNSAWVLSTADPITLNTTSLSFSQFSGAGQITAGTGLEKSGNTISIAAQGVTNALVANNAGIAYGKLSIAAGDIAAVKLAADVAGTGMTSTNGVLTVATSGIVTTKIADDAVTADKIADGAIDAAAKVASGVITAVKLAADVAGAGLTSTSGVLAVACAGGTLTVATDDVKVADALSLVTSLTTPQLTVSGAVYETGVQAPITAAGTAIASTTRYVLFNGTSSYNQDLPTAVLGRVISFKKGTTGTVTIRPVAGEYLDGAQYTSGGSGAAGTLDIDTPNAAFTLVAMANGAWSVF